MPKTAREIAVEIVKKYVDPFIASGHANCLYSDVCGDAFRAIETALIQSREEALEEAEKIAKKLAEKERARGCDYQFPPAAFIEVAEAIAKLKGESNA